MDNLPIDIHATKLLEWLISRRHVGKDWSDQLTTIRSKIKAALMDMPEHQEIAKLLRGSQLNYYNCSKIVEILKQTEAASKNFFGYYSSQRMKDWQEIVKLYEKDNVYLAEAAQIIIRNVAYELPSLRREMSKLEQATKEFERKGIEYQRQAASHKEEYASAVQRLGIKGVEPKRELLDMLNQLPSIYGEILKNLIEVDTAINYYKAFVSFTSKDHKQLDLLPALRYLITKGNTTYYQYRTGDIPQIVEDINSNVGQDESSTVDDDAIDFGDDDGCIDFGDETGSESLNGGFVHVESEDACEDGDNPIVLNAENEEKPEVKPSEGKIAKGLDAYTILDYHETRNAIINNLYELEGFLNQRLYESKLEDDIITVSQFEAAPTDIHEQNKGTFEKMLKQVSTALEMLTTPKIKTLFYMRDSPRYVDQVANKLKHRLEMAEKAIQTSKLMEEKQKEALQTLRKIAPKIPALASKTKELQKLMEVDISKRYKNRPVNIMGGVQ